jgi:TonB-linked SusC/RagA family outer membrane protein
MAGVSSLHAQGGTIRGTVTDRTTIRPLANAGVILVDQNRVTQTDEDGVYRFTGLTPGQYTVRARAIGYSSQSATVTVTATGEVTLDFQFDRAIIQLDEIVVTGTPGATTKRELGNAITSLSVADLTEIAPIANVQELLNARAPGLTLYSNSGLAGAASNVKIRGAGSLNAGYTPVYYIDGIRFEANPISNGGTTNSTVQFASPMDFVNPGDIERIEVIKGPAAATLYGADAAGGVIQIITKKGNRGSERVQWNMSYEYSSNKYTAENPINYYLCNAVPMQPWTGSSTLRRQASSTYPGCQDPTQITFVAENGDTVTGIPESDIIRTGPDGTPFPDGAFVLVDDPVRRHPEALRVGVGSDLRLSARGGTQTFGYYISAVRSTEQGVAFNNFSNKTGGRANFSVTPATWINMDVNFGYTRSQGQIPLSDNASNGLLRNAFRGRARATADSWTSGYFGFGPTESNEFDRKSFEERTTLGVTTNINPVSWFTSRLTLGMDKYDRRDQTFYEIDPTLKWGATNGTGAITQRVPTTHTWTVDYSGTINAKLSESVVSNFSGGMQLNSREFRRYTASGDGLIANALNLVGSAANTEADEGFVEQTSLGLYFMEQLAFNDKIYGSAAVRFDDNSAFGADFSLVVYPKFSLAYIISDEDWFSLPGVDEMKLRFAWGQAGNAPSPFSADRTYSPEVTTFQDESVNALTPSSFGNVDLTAETGQEYEVGFDASLFNGGLGLEFTYYNQHTKDALMSIPDAPSTGFTGSHDANIGEIKNTGLELLATVNPIRSNKLNWDASLSIATNHNELVSFGGSREQILFGAFTNSQRHREGYPLGSFWATDVARNADGSIIPTSSGGVTVNNSCTWPDTDDPNGPGGSCQEIYLGSSTPTWEIGLANTFTIGGNLRVYAHLDSKGGNWLVCAICSIRNRSNTNTWEVANPLADPLEVLRWRSLQTMTHLSKADFIKLRELSVSYNLPTSWGGAFSARRWTVTLSGRNLWTATKYEGTGDPEVSFTSSPTSFDRTDYAAFPAPRRIGASINVTF